MAEHDTQLSKRCGLWLKKARGRMPQTEAIEVMRDKHNFGVSVVTWSRWETGKRLPPEDKINAVALTVNASPARARQLAGYKVPPELYSTPYMTPTGMSQLILREFMDNPDPLKSAINIYMLLKDYHTQSEQGGHINTTPDSKLMRRIMAVFALLENAPAEGTAGDVGEDQTAVRNCAGLAAASRYDQ